MLEEINHFIQNLNSEYGNHENTIISYKYDINQFNNFIKKKKKSFKSIIKKDILDFLENLKLKNVKNNILFGREYLSMGYGKFSSLIISKDSRPFDQLKWSIIYYNISGSLGAIQLENNNKGNGTTDNHRNVISEHVAYA